MLVLKLITLIVKLHPCFTGAIHPLDIGGGGGGAIIKSIKVMHFLSYCYVTQIQQ